MLVTQAGLAPVFWLQDDQGFTLDRVVAPVRTSAPRPTDVAMGGGDLMVRVHPLVEETRFPTREELPGTALRVEITNRSRVVFDGQMRPGDTALLEHVSLVMEEYRLWVRLRVVHERGSGLLVAGFVIGITGLIWRLLLYRREVAMTWDGEAFQLVGRAEYFSWRFKEELESIRSALARPTVETERSERSGVASG